MKKIIDYFDIYNQIRPTVSERTTEGTPERDVPWPFQWLALLAGILIQPSFAYYQSHGVWKFDGFVGWMGFAVITAVIVFPAVYRNSFDPAKPVFIQIIPIFTAGLGWQSLLTTAAKAATSS
jgi:hypothetical protein